MEFIYAMGIVFIKSFSILKWLPTGRSMLRFKTIGGHGNKMYDSCRMAHTV